MMMNDLLAIIGVVMMTFALEKVDYLWLLFLGRAITGISLGINLGLISPYIKEICPKKL